MMAGRGQALPTHMQAMMNPQMYAYMMQQRQQMSQGEIMQYPPYIMLPYGHMPYGMQPMAMPLAYQTQMATGMVRSSFLHTMCTQLYHC